MEPGALILVVMVEPQVIGYHFRRKRLDWPLHITLVPWFQAADEQEVLATIGKVLTATPRFEVTVGTDELFGDTNVSLIQAPNNTAVLHDALLEAVADHVVFSKAPEWIGDQYRPHITHHGEARLNQGDVVRVDGVTIVKLMPGNMCQVIDTIHLKV